MRPVASKIPPRPGNPTDDAAATAGSSSGQVPPRPGQAEKKSESTHTQIPPRPGGLESAAEPQPPPLPSPPPPPEKLSAEAESLAEPPAASATSESSTTPPPPLARNVPTPSATPPIADEPSHADKPPQQTPANEPAGSAAAAGRETDGPEKVSRERSEFAAWVRQSPPWLVSMIVHAMILIALALLALPVEVQHQFFELITLQPSDVDEEIDNMLDDELEINVESDVQVASDVAEPVEAITDQDFDIESEVTEVATAADDLALAASPLTFDFFADTSAATADVTSVIGGKALTGLGGRSNKGRQALVRKGGGTRGSENAVEAALRWL
ncbi:MAG: hypothetical protein VB853_03340, partial [Pirellulales bacterium]